MEIREGDNAKAAFRVGNMGFYPIFGRAHRSLTVGFLLLQHFNCFVLSSLHLCNKLIFVFSEM